MGHLWIKLKLCVFVVSVDLRTLYSKAHLRGQLLHKAVGVGLAVKAHSVIDLAAHRLAHAARLHLARVAPVRVIPDLHRSTKLACSRHTFLVFIFNCSDAPC